MTDDDDLRTTLADLRHMTSRLNRRLRSARSLLHEIESCIDRLASRLDDPSAPAAPSREPRDGDGDAGARTG